MVDPMLFAKLKEGQQVAVITLQDTSTASVNLFISILDQTGESHEIVFFVPLGVKADGFAVWEQDSLAFNDQFTKRQLNIWRVTYTNSNAVEDILVTVNKGSGTNFGASLRRAGPQLAFIIGLVIAALFWITAWYFLMPRLLSRDRKTKGLWRLSLTYIGWNALLFVPGAILYFIFSFGEQVLALLLLVLLFGGASVLTFALRHLHKLGVSTAQSIRAFVVVTLVSNGAYLLFVLGYAKLAGVI